MAFETRVSVTTNPTTSDTMATGQSTIQLEQLIDQNLEEFKDAFANRVAVQFQNQEQLLEEARRDLDMYKKAFFDTERAKRDLEEMFEQEKQVLNNEIRQLKAIVTREQRVVHQQDPPPVPADTQQHAIVHEGTVTA